MSSLTFLAFLFLSNSSGKSAFKINPICTDVVTIPEMVKVVVENAKVWGGHLTHITAYPKQEPSVLGSFILV